jgi:hypothetical protein
VKRVIVLFFVCLVANARAARFLFDADHAESGNNADWVIDADVHNLTWESSGTFSANTGGNESNAQRIPTPAASGITASTPETYWAGAISAWAVDLVKRGHSVETLPAGTTLTWNTSNSQDLTNYDVVVIDEPDILFASGEKQALINFVSHGGGLFMISDHVGSVRTQGSGGIDAVTVWNDFLTNNGVTNNPFGIVFRMTGTGSNSSGNNTFNRSTVGNPILNGPVGMATNMAYFNGDEFQIDNTKNPTATSQMWFGALSDSNNFCGLASLQYGNGRVVVCGDSSCIDDGTGDPNDTSLYDGYTTDAGGVQHIWILNSSEWLAAASASAPLSVGVTNVTPACGSTAGGTAVTVTGSNFLSGATVTFGGVSATSVVVVNSNTVTAVTPAGTSGAKIVQVTNTSGKFGALTNGFAYGVPPSPSNSGPTCSGQTLTLFANTNAASYSWSGPNGFTAAAQNPTIANVTTADAGTYVLSVGCASVTGMTTVAVNALPNNHNVTGGGAFCSGGIGVAVGLDGSDSGVRYQLVRNSAINVGSPVAGTGGALIFGSQTVAGVYTVTASNTTTSCTLAMSGSATVTVNPLPTVTTLPVGSVGICNGASVTLNASGASTYSWSPASGLDTTTGTAVHASPANTTTYTVTGTDANGCQNSTNVTVTVNPLLTCSVSPATATICIGGSQSFVVNPSGGTGPYTVGWSGPNGHNGSTSSNTVTNAQSADAGTYSVTITDANGCTTSCSGTLVVNIPVTPSVPAIATPVTGFCINAAGAAGFTVSGTADTNSPIQIFANAVLIGSTVADGAGNWSTNLNFTSQPDGLLSLTAVATNPCSSSAPSTAISGTKDTTAPSFAGIGGITPAIESATLTWSAASDSNTVIYQVFQATGSGAENFGAPTLSTNSLSAFLSPLYPGSNSPITYFFVIRAVDGCGNSESNAVEQSVQPLLDPNKSQVSDGIPNGWKQQYGFNPFDPAVAAGDADGDGLSNLQEFLAGTDPTNAASALRITSVMSVGSDVLINWMTGLGRTNALQGTPGAADGSYATNGFADIFTVTNTTGIATNYLDPGAATNIPSRYYRVRLVP